MILKTEMLPHQMDAYQKLIRHKVGAAFMEMGTGKSRVALQIAAFYHPKPVIWVCPKNTHPAIRDEIEKHSEGLSITLQSSEGLSQSTKQWLAFNEMAKSSPVLIVDESHLFKSPYATRSKRLVSIAHLFCARYIMTGTPIGQGIEDFYTQFAILSKKILGYASFANFAHYHLVFDPDNKGRIMRRHYQDYVTTKIAPYTYQVKKSEVMTLPAKTYSYDMYDMPRVLRKAYEDYMNDVMNDRLFFEAPGVAIYKMFSGLQRICSGHKPGEDESFLSADENPRIDALLNILERSTDEKVIVWARYTRDIEQIQSVLQDSVVLHGGLSDAEKQESIQRFRSSARVLIANPKTGGIGLTLNEASLSIFYSHSFDYIERCQAEDRCHRIGQTKNVHYVSIYSNSKIERLLKDVVERKTSLAKVLQSKIEAIKKAKSQKEAIKLIKEMS